MRTRVAACLVGALAVYGAERAEAQACRPELVRAGQGRAIDRGPGRTHQFLSGGVLIRCIGQNTTVRSDSVAWYEDLQRMDFVGAVRFQDDTVTLDAQQARYFPSAERLEATGAVRLVNRLSGTSLTGPNLTYWRAAPGVRDTAEMLSSGRPTVRYRATGDTTDPYVIVADRVRLWGGSLAGARGRVTVERQDFWAAGDSATLEFDAGTGFLVGHAEARSTDTAGYQIEGRRLEYRVDEADRLRWLQAQGAAEATSSEWRVLGDTIEFDIRADRVQAGRVWGDSVRPRALSERHTVEGDSLAIDSPDQELREVRAFGRGRATARRAIDAPEVDWVEGDTVVAQFEAAPDGAGRALRRLHADGGARAYYHIFEQGADSTALPAIAYSRGRRIVVRFADDELERVDVVDAADGVYLEPRVRRP